MSQTRAIVDKLLSNVSAMYVPDGFIAETVLPQLKVVQSTGKLGKYGTSHLRIVDDIIGGRAEAQIVNPIDKSNSTYNMLNHALMGIVTKDDLRNSEQPYDAEKDETLGVTTLIQLNKERALSSVLTNASVITQNTTLSGTSQFSDYTGSAPLSVARDAQNAVLDGCGYMPNKCLMSQKVFNSLKYHPEILDRLGFKQNRAGNLTASEIAQALDVAKLFIGNVAYESANEGQTSSLAQLWGKDMIMFYAPDSAAKYQVSLGYYVSDTGGRRVYKFPLNNPPESTGIIVQDDYSFELTNAKAAYLIKDAIA